MTRKRKLVLWTLGVLVVLIAAFATYLLTSDLEAWRDLVARAASRAMNRELTIGGEFAVDLGFVTRVRATDLTLANTEWGTEPVMAAIDRLDGEIDLRALVSGSMHLPRVEIDGGRAVFESDPEAGSNWALGRGGGGEGGGGSIRLRIDSIRARSVDLVFRTVSAERDWDVAIAELDSTGDETGIASAFGRRRSQGTPLRHQG